MNFKLVGIDETKYWRLLPDCVEKVICGYLIDVSREVHICSLTPSHEAWHVGSIPIIDYDATDQQAEKAHEFILEHDITERVVYFKAGEYSNVVDLSDQQDPDYDYEEQVDHLIDIIHSNYILAELEDVVMT